MTKLPYEISASGDDVELSDVSHSHKEGSPEDNLDNLELEYDQYKAAENQTRDAGNAGDNQEEHYELGPGKQSFQAQEMELPSASTFSSFGSIPNYEETPVSMKEYYNHSLKEMLTFRSAGNYFLSLFPIIKWFPHYNLTWGYADLVAGITVGCVLVPQSMSYAQIALLPAQYGLYSSFIGAFFYSIFATSKDVCIGPVAVMSLQTAKVITEVLKKYPDDEAVVTGPIIATTLALLCGIVAFAVGVLRLGFLVEFISLNAVAGFMTGSAFNIIWGQVPALMGYSKLVNTRVATYKVAINSLKHLPDTKLDAVFGLIPLFILYVWKWWCGTYGPKLAERHLAHDPRKKKALLAFYFYAQAMRNAVIIIVFTAISWRITRNKSTKNQPIKVLGTVPSGLKDVGVMKIPEGLLAKMGPEIPASIIVLLLEHIAISKSFGRINDYKVVPDQELIAIGVTNLVGTFFNAYPATGSFSRSALKAKCNVRTPFSGVFTGGCVLLALYCLTEAFYFIPSATLSAVIIHAVSDLLASYKTTWNFWKMNPLDFLAFIVTVLITVFSSIENGIYFAMCWSCAMLLLKQAFPAGRFLGRVEVAEVISGSINDSNEIVTQYSVEADSPKAEPNSSKKLKADNDKGFVSSPSSSPRYKYHTKWFPSDHGYTRELNPDVKIQPPPPGVLVYRFSDSYTYLNCSRHYDILFDEIKKQTRRGQLIQLRKKSDRPWNDPGEWEMPASVKKFFRFKKRKDDEEEIEAVDTTNNKDRDDRPVLKVLCLDFSQVAQVDSTAIQSLADLRRAVNRYADRQVEFHFSGIISSWVKRSLLSMGFGTINEEFSDESITAGHTCYHLARLPQNSDQSFASDSNEELGREYDVYAATGTNLPFFHIDIPDFSKWDI